MNINQPEDHKATRPIIKQRWTDHKQRGPIISKCRPIIKQRGPIIKQCEPIMKQREPIINAAGQKHRPYPIARIMKSVKAYGSSSNLCYTSLTNETGGIINMNNQEKPHILLIDGMALLFRSFFATSAMGHYFPNAEGTPTNGVQGFARHTMTATSLFKPSHMAVCWDMSAHTFRNDLFDGYKANRPAPAPELVPQFDMARSVSELIGWKNYGILGMEADDLIGSMVETWDGKADITIVTGDKDLLQLLRPGVRIAFMKKGYNVYDIYTYERFVEEYGISPKQFIDMKAFTGDSE